jgi:hypothetical protein
MTARVRRSVCIAGFVVKIWDMGSQRLCFPGVHTAPIEPLPQPKRGPRLGVDKFERYGFGIEQRALCIFY